MQEELIFRTTDIHLKEISTNITLLIDSRMITLDRETLEKEIIKAGILMIEITIEDTLAQDFSKDRNLEEDLSIIDKTDSRMSLKYQEIWITSRTKEDILNI